MIAQHEELQQIIRLSERSKKLLWAVIDSTPNWIFAKDEQLRYVLANKPLADALNTTPQQMIGKNDLEIGLTEEHILGNPSKGIRGSHADDEVALGGKTVYNPRNLVVGHDGRTSILDTHKIPLFDEDGKVFGILGISRDVTEKRQVEEELEQYRYQLEQLVVDRTDRLEFVIMLSGQLNTIRDLNELLTELVNRLQESFGYNHVHVYLIENETSDLVLFESSDEDGKQLPRLAIGEGILGNVAHQNQHFWSNDLPNAPGYIHNPLLPDVLSELAVPIRKGKLVIGVLDIQNNQPDSFTQEDVVLMQSIADQTAIAIDNARLLAERQATISKLQEVDRAKSQFITMMSHELRTPLNAINGFTELLLMGLSGDLPEQAVNDLKLIFESGQHLLALINDILDISQVESGQIQIVLQTVDVAEIVNEVVSASMLLVNNKPIEIINAVSDKLPPVEADETRLKQILSNLVNNAVKFTSEGTVTLEAKITANMMQFSVIDTGVGVPLEKQQEIFEAFQQADMSDARKYGGTGLGLSICKQLVEMHEGEIWVESEVGVGSQFHFTIPVAGN
jgi:PAS domain S-box-containing protein